MKKSYIILFALLFIGLTDINAQAPCNLTGGSVYIDHSTGPWMMNASVNGMSLYDYSWTDTNGFVISIANQTPFYSQWCVTITDNLTGCDTIICQDCVADSTATCICTMIYMPVCGCDGVMYSNSCLADCADVPWTPAVSNGMPGGFLPCPPPSSCEVEIDGDSILCSWGNAQVLTASPTALSNPFISYLWSNGQTGPVLTITSPGTYCVTATDSSGCVDSACFTVSVQLIDIYSAPNPPIICLDDSIVLEIDTVGLSNITWIPNSLPTPPVHRIVFTPMFSTTCVVEAIDDAGCDRRGEIFVTVDSCFTYNNNLINSYLKVYPNPTNGSLFIENKLNTSYNVTLIDITGKVVFIQLSLTGLSKIDIDALNSGLFIIKIEDSSGSYFKKILIE